MTARCFVDSNVFLYAASNEPVDAPKRKIAQTLISSEDIGLSAQVMQEFLAVAASKSRLKISAEEIGEMTNAFLNYPIVPITSKLVLDAWEIKSHNQISYWDAAIVAAARELKSEIIFSEDLNAGQQYEGILLVNPFIGKRQ